ncbi:geranylgeranyl pyrophosphate synthetase [Aspergillus indologenus CBS 114.80]|uniref:Geranylgeranyl pyrophosphate synthetase n=1 Tax=Aspergillus indologenus CBS 114.80 TaxID=1450541 RepID=A0A2V5ID83_9EURO|nr:geranylgeranyl pyrophosphate synthetase [Aspergillus indologenus CBS 114.80]
MLRAPAGRYRASIRGGSRRGWLGLGHQTRKPEPVYESPAPPCGPLLVEIEQYNLGRSQESPRITSCEYLTSYTWLGRESPSIIIPGIAFHPRDGLGTSTLTNPISLGEPPVWTPPTEDRQLQPDCGEYLRDPNTARYPAYPWEAAFTAIEKQCPEYDLANTDIVTCSSTLGNLNRFARGVDKSFRFVLETVGDTVFFVRRENSPKDLIPDVRGYGHTFLDEYTTWRPDLAGSESHQRIIQYDFGGLHFLVRFESDGYIPEKRSQRQECSSSDGERRMPNETLEAEVARLIGKLGGDHTPEPTQSSGDLKVREGGRLISQSAIIDIKTRSMFDFQTRTVKKEIDMTDLTPRLWVSQIPTLVVAYHDRGLFTDIRVQDMREQITQWERDKQELLGRLAWILHELVQYAKSSMTRLEVCRTDSGPLQIRRLIGDAPLALSPGLKARWTEGDDLESSGHGSFSSHDSSCCDTPLEAHLPEHRFSHDWKDHKD